MLDLRVAQETGLRHPRRPLQGGKGPAGAAAELAIRLPGIETQGVERGLNLAALVAVQIQGRLGLGVAGGQGDRRLRIRALLGSCGLLRHPLAEDLPGRLDLKGETDSAG